MSIQPIDLQVLFSRLEQMGKEQAAQKDVSVQNQLLQGNELVKKSEHRNHSVNETKEAEQGGVNRLKDEKRRRSSGRSGKEAASDEQENAEPEREVVKDPNLGKNIDLEG